MRLRIRRLGGIAGVTLKSVLDTAELPADQARRVEGSIRDLAGHSPAGPPRPDGFRYEMTLLDDPDQAPILVDERDLPPELRGLIQAVGRSAEIEHRE